MKILNKMSDCSIALVTNVVTCTVFAGIVWVESFVNQERLARASIFIPGDRNLRPVKNSREVLLRAYAKLLLLEALF